MNDHEAQQQHTDRELPSSKPAGHLPVSVRAILDDYYDASSFGSSSLDAMSAANAVLAEVDDVPLGDEKYGTNSSLSKTQGPWDIEGDDNDFVPDKPLSHGDKTENDGLGPLVSRFQGSPPFVRHREPQDPVDRCNYFDVPAQSITPEPTKMIARLDSIPSDRNEDSENHQVDLLCDRMNELANRYNGKYNAINDEEVNECSLGRNITDTLQTKLESVADSTFEVSPKASPKQCQASCQPDPAVPSTRQGDSTKRPFLRKGARKEPSALHRFETETQNAQRRHNNQANRGDSLKKEKLKELERMQEKQREDLKKRMERRQSAREEIRRRKKGCKLQVVGDMTMKEKKIENDRRSNDEDRNEYSGSDTDMESGRDSDSDSESESDSNSDLLGSSVDDSGKSDVSTSLNTKVKLTPQKAGSKKTRNSTLHRRTPEVKRSGEMSMKKGSNSLSQKSGCERKSKSGRSKVTEFKSPELNEQWQVIKSMRKRQEAALRSAEMEREQARAWATSEREKLTKWREQQRSMIQKEKQRVINDAMVSQRRERKKKLEDQAAEATLLSQKQAREEIEKLKSNLQKQKIDADAAKSRQRLNEKRLRDMVTERDTKITLLKEELKEVRERNERLEQKRDDLIKERDMQAAARKKKGKKKKLRKERDCRRSSEEEEPSEHTNGKFTVDGCRTSDNYSCAKSACSAIDTDVKENLVLERKGGDDCVSKSETSNHDDRNSLDKDAIRVISSNQDLFDEPTEDWLRRHLNDLKAAQHSSLQMGECESVGPNLSFCTPTKKKTYDPAKYTPMKTPQTEQSKGSNADKIALHLENNPSQRPQESRGADGRRIVTYKNGTQKETLLDGTSIVRFTNGDIKTSYSNVGIVVYYYSESKTSHTQHPDGTEVFEFATGQTEKHFPDGRKEIQFPDGTMQIFFGSGGSEIVYADGLKVVESQTGSKQIINF